MKLETKETEVRGTIGLKSSEASISEEDIDKLYKLIEAPYKRPISSIVREYTSNCFDSHQEAGVDDAVIIKLDKSKEIGYYISFHDVGVGMSEDRMTNVFIKLLKSTKELTNDAIGAFGMGSKAGLSYNDFFFIETNFDGQYYKYIYRKGEKRPTLDLLIQEDTSERNGTKFIVPIKNESDVVTFAEACNNQLHYFENVVYDYKNLSNFLGYQYNYVKEYLDNDFKLYKGKNFTIRLDKNTWDPSKSDLHILNGPVYYPIDFNNISNIDKYKDLQIGLNFEIGELDVIQTREDVRYNEKTVKIIKERLRDAIEELQKIYGTEDIIETKTYNEYVIKKNNSDNNYILIGEGDYKVTLRHKDVFPTKKVILKPFYDIDPNYNVPTNFKNYIFDRFIAHKTLTSSEFPNVKANVTDETIHKNYSNNIYTNVDLQKIINNSKSHDLDLPKMIITRDKNAHSVKLNKQIAFKNDESSFNYAIPMFYLVNHREWVSDDDSTVDYYNKLLYYNDNNDIIRDKLVKLFFAISDKYVDNIIKQPNIIDYDNTQLDKTWYSDFATRTRKKATSRDNSLVNIKFRSSRAWDTYKMTMHDLANYNSKYTIFIAPENDKDSLTLIGHESEYHPKSLFSNKAIQKRCIKLISLAPSNYKKLAKLVENKNNYYTMEDYINNKGDIKFKYLADLYIYHKLKESEMLNFILNSSSANSVVRKSISEEFDSLIVDVKEYTDNIHYYYSSWYRANSEKIVSEIENLSDFVDIKKHFILQKIDKLKNYYVYFKHFFESFSKTHGKNNYNKSALDFIATTLVLTNYNRLGIVRSEIYEPVDKIEYDGLIECVANENSTELELDHILSLVRIKKYEIKNMKLI